MILHFIYDDIFVKYVVQHFAEERKGSLIIDCDPNGKFSFAKGLSNIKKVKAFSQEFNDIKASLGNYEAVVFHGLFGNWCSELLRCMPKHVVVAWSMWDGEIFGREDVLNKHLLPLTRYLRKLKLKHRELVKGAKASETYYVPVELFKGIKYCICDMPQECETANQYLGTHMQWMPYNYYSIEKTVGALKQERAKGKNIFLGNACSYDNNHIEALWMIHQCIGKGQKVITPLSYGDVGLRKHILRTGRLLLRNSFEPLLNFMPLEEYNKQMLSCSVMIQNHLHPQAQGNIITGLWLGMRVYLRKTNITYQFFKSIGANVSSIEDDFNTDNPHLYEPLTDEELETNRRVLHDYYSDEMTLGRVDEILRVLESDNVK